MRATTLLFVFAVLDSAQAFAPTPSSSSSVRSSTRLSAVTVLTPVGPFCPFRRSDDGDDTPPPFDVKQMADLIESVQSGNMPNDPKRLMQAARDMDTAADQWISLIRTANDFGTREFAMIVQANLESFGLSIPAVVALLRWQRDCLQCVAHDLPDDDLPDVPAELDIDLMRRMQSMIPDRTDIPVVVPRRCAVTAHPFVETRLSSEGRDAYRDLLRDHARLMTEVGAEYARFDSAQQQAFLDDVARMEDRWSEFFSRYGSGEALDPEYVRQCDAFLGSMGIIRVADLPILLAEAHRRMREDAKMIDGSNLSVAR